MSKLEDLQDFLANGEPFEEREACETRREKRYNISIMDNAFYNIRKLTELNVTEITDIVMLGSTNIKELDKYNVRIYFKFLVREGEDTQKTLESNIIVDYVELM